VTDLELDIATVLARIIQLDQLRADLDHFDLPEFIWHRVMACDVPRLRRHLGEDTLQLLDQIAADSGG
jgi:hypothetical protein